MDNQSANTRTDALLQRVNDLCAADLPTGEKIALFGELIYKIIGPYQSTVRSRVELETGREPFYVGKKTDRSTIPLI
jgi:hypothetical protein